MSATAAPAIGALEPMAVAGGASSSSSSSSSSTCSSSSSAGSAISTPPETRPSGSVGGASGSTAVAVVVEAASLHRRASRSGSSAQVKRNQSQSSSTASGNNDDDHQQRAGQAIKFARQATKSSSSGGAANGPLGNSNNDLATPAPTPHRARNDQSKESAQPMVAHQQDQQHSSQQGYQAARPRSAGSTGGSVSAIGPSTAEPRVQPPPPPPPQQQQQQQQLLLQPSYQGGPYQGQTEQQSQQPTQLAPRRRGRRRQQAIQEQPNGLDRVFVWDLDGSLMRSDIIIASQAAADAQNSTPSEPSVLTSVTDKLSGLSKQLKQITLKFCDESLHLSELELTEQMHIDDVPADSTGGGGGDKQATNNVPGAEGSPAKANGVLTQANKSHHAQDKTQPVKMQKVLLDEQVNDGTTAESNTIRFHQPTSETTLVPEALQQAEQPLWGVEANTWSQQHNNVHHIQQHQQLQPGVIHHHNLEMVTTDHHLHMLAQHSHPHYHQHHHDHHHHDHYQQPSQLVEPFAVSSLTTLEATNNTHFQNQAQDHHQHQHLAYHRLASPHAHSHHPSQVSQHHHQGAQEFQMGTVEEQMADEVQHQHQQPAEQSVHASQAIQMDGLHHRMSCEVNSSHQLISNNNNNNSDNNNNNNNSHQSHLSELFAYNNQVVVGDGTVAESNTARFHQLTSVTALVPDALHQTEQTLLGVETSTWPHQHNNAHHIQQQQQLQQQQQPQQPQQPQQQQHLQHIQQPQQPGVIHHHNLESMTTDHHLHMLTNHPHQQHHPNPHQNHHDHYNNNHYQQPSQLVEPFAVHSLTTLEAPNDPHFQHQAHHHHQHHHLAYHRLASPHARSHHQLQVSQHHQHQEAQEFRMGVGEEQMVGQAQQPAEESVHASPAIQMDDLHQRAPSEVDPSHHLILQSNSSSSSSNNNNNNSSSNGQQSHLSELFAYNNHPNPHHHYYHHHHNHHHHNNNSHHHYQHQRISQQQVHHNNHPVEPEAAILPLQASMNHHQYQTQHRHPSQQQQQSLGQENQKALVQGEQSIDIKASGNSHAQTTTLKTVLSNHHKQVSQRLSVRFHRLRTIYNQYRGTIPAIELKPDIQGDHDHHPHQQQQPVSLQYILEEIDHYTLDWRKHSIDCLRMISESQNCTNIIITRMPLTVALGHLVCLGFSSYFDIDQIYSSSKTSKEICIKRIKKRFGATNRCSYIIVGDKEDADMARKLDLPCWNTSRSDGHRQLVQLYTALKEGYLM